MNEQSSGAGPDSPDPVVRRDVSDAEVIASADSLAARMELLTRNIGTLSGQQKRSWHAILGLAGVWVIDVVLIIAVAFFGWRVSSTSECQARQNDAFRAVSIQSRAIRENQDDQLINQYQRQIQRLDEQLTLFSTFLDNPNTPPEQRRAAFVAYKNTVLADRAATVSAMESIVAAKQARADNPLPSGNCS